MTVAYLMSILADKPSTARVILSGYEGGYSDVVGCIDMPIRIDTHRKKYYGPHEGCKPEVADEVAVYIA